MSARILSSMAFVVAFCAIPAAAQLRVESVERDQLISVDGDRPEIAEAVRKARATLAAFFARMESPANGMHAFAVKIGVPTRRGMEYIWISDLRRQDDRIIGRIDNTPRWTTRIRAGQRIAFQDSDIVDWLHIEDNRLKGNFISCAMNKMSSAVEAKAMVDRFRMDCDE